MNKLKKRFKSMACIFLCCIMMTGCDKGTLCNAQFNLSERLYWISFDDSAAYLCCTDNANDIQKIKLEDGYEYDIISNEDGGIYIVRYSDRGEQILYTVNGNIELKQACTLHISDIQYAFAIDDRFLYYIVDMPSEQVCIAKYDFEDKTQSIISNTYKRTYCQVNPSVEKEKIIYSKEAVFPDNSVYMIEGNVEKKLVKGENPIWSDDGTFLYIYKNKVYKSNVNSAESEQLTVKGGKPIKISPRNISCGGIDVSRDGKFIAYYASKEAPRALFFKMDSVTPELRLINLTTGEEITIPIQKKEHVVGSMVCFVN